MKHKRLYTDFIDDIFEATQKIDKFIEGMTFEQFVFFKHLNLINYACPLSSH